MKRKLVSCLLVLILTLSSISISEFNFTKIFLPCAEAAENIDCFSWGDYEYILISDTEIEITKYLGNDRKVSIPSEINGLSVSAVGKYSFNGQVMWSGNEGKYIEHPNADNNIRITEISIPSSVNKIEEYAFANLKKLKKINLSEGLKAIDVYAFSNCVKLEDISLPVSLEEISFTAFNNTKAEEIILGRNVTKLYYEEPKYSSVKRIICNAENIDITIHLPYDLSSIEEIVCNGNINDALISEQTGSLQRIICKGKTNYSTVLNLLKNEFYYNYDEENNQIIFSTEKIGAENEMVENGFRYYVNKNNEAVITRYIAEESVINVPSALGGYIVTEIAPFAFSSMLAEDIEFIKGNDYHISMDLITEVNLPETINQIQEYAFAYNVNLKKINIPSGVTSVPEGCFYYCSALDSVILPDGLSEIGAESFIHCESLKNIIIPDNVKEIGVGAFDNCISLESASIIGVIKVGERAFNHCTALNNVEYTSELADIGDSAFSYTSLSGTVDLSNVSTLGACAFMNCEKIEKVILSDNILKLEFGTFQCCYSLIEVNFPDKLVSIGNSCFRGSGLKEAVFGRNLKQIEALAFEFCKNLYVAEFREGLEKIGSFAFEYTAVEVISIPESLKIIGYKSFANCKSLETLYFNAANCKIGDYFNEDEELDFENLKKESPFYGCNIKEIYLGDNVSAIGNATSEFGAFENCTEIESVVIPGTVTEIGNAAFKNCSNLETAVISDSVTQIADNAFEGCEKLNILCFENSFAHLYALEQGIKVSTFIVSAIPNQTYTGYEIKPEVNVSYSGDSLNRNVDFNVSYSNNIDVGNAVVTIKGKNDYKNFSSKVNFKIITKSIANATIAPIVEQNYTGYAVTPSLTVTDGNRLLCEGNDYTASFSNNVKVGTATAKITGKGNYSGSLSVEFQIMKLTNQQNFFNRLTTWLNTSLIKLRSFITNILK